MSYGMLNLLTSSPMKRMTSLPSRDAVAYDISENNIESIETADLEADDFVGLDALDDAANDKYAVKKDTSSSSLSVSQTRYRALSLSTNNLVVTNSTHSVGDKSDRDGGSFGSFEDIDFTGGTRGRPRERSLVTHDHDTFRPSPLSNDAEDDSIDNTGSTNTKEDSMDSNNLDKNNKDSSSVEESVSVSGGSMLSPKIRRSSSRSGRSKDSESSDSDANNNTTNGDKEGVQRASGRPNFLDVKTAEVVDYQVQDADRPYAVFRLNVQIGNRHWTIHRRFNDFKNVHGLLGHTHSREELAGVKLPPQRIFKRKKFDPAYLYERCEQLDEYIHKLLEVPTLADDPVVMDFLSNNWRQPKRPKKNINSGRDMGTAGPIDLTNRKGAGVSGGIQPGMSPKEIKRIIARQSKQQLGRGRADRRKFVRNGPGVVSLGASASGPNVQVEEQTGSDSSSTLGQQGVPFDVGMARVFNMKGAKNGNHGNGGKKRKAGPNVARKARLPPFNTVYDVPPVSVVNCAPKCLDLQKQLAVEYKGNMLFRGTPNNDRVGLDLYSDESEDDTDAPREGGVDAYAETDSDSMSTSAASSLDTDRRTSESENKVDMEIDTSGDESFGETLNTRAKHTGLTIGVTRDGAISATAGLPQRDDRMPPGSVVVDVKEIIALEKNKELPDPHSPLIPEASITESVHVGKVTETTQSTHTHTHTAPRPPKKLTIPTSQKGGHKLQQSAHKKKQQQQQQANRPASEGGDGDDEPGKGVFVAEMDLNFPTKKLVSRQRSLTARRSAGLGPSQQRQVRMDNEVLHNHKKPLITAKGTSVPAKRPPLASRLSTWFSNALSFNEDDEMDDGGVQSDERSTSESGGEASDSSGSSEVLVKPAGPLTHQQLLKMHQAQQRQQMKDKRRHPTQQKIPHAYNQKRVHALLLPSSSQGLNAGSPSSRQSSQQQHRQVQQLQHQVQQLHHKKQQQHEHQKDLQRQQQQHERRHSSHSIHSNSQHDDTTHATQRDVQQNGDKAQRDGGGGYVHSKSLSPQSLKRHTSTGGTVSAIESSGLHKSASMGKATKDLVQRSDETPLARSNDTGYKWEDSLITSNESGIGSGAGNGIDARSDSIMAAVEIPDAHLKGYTETVEIPDVHLKGHTDAVKAPDVHLRGHVDKGVEVPDVHLRHQADQIEIPDEHVDRSVGERRGSLASESVTAIASAVSAGLNSIISSGVSSILGGSKSVDSVVEDALHHGTDTDVRPELRTGNSDGLIQHEQAHKHEDESGWMFNRTQSVPLSDSPKAKHSTSASIAIAPRGSASKHDNSSKYDNYNTGGRHRSEAGATIGSFSPLSPKYSPHTRTPAQRHASSPLPHVSMLRNPISLPSTQDVNEGSESDDGNHGNSISRQSSANSVTGSPRTREEEKHHNMIAQQQLLLKSYSRLRFNRAPITPPNTHSPPTNRLSTSTSADVANSGTQSVSTARLLKRAATSPTRSRLSSVCSTERGEDSDHSVAEYAVELTGATSVLDEDVHTDLSGKNSASMDGILKLKEDDGGISGGGDSTPVGRYATIGTETHNRRGSTDRIDSSSREGDILVFEALLEQAREATRSSSFPNNMSSESETESSDVSTLTELDRSRSPDQSDTN